MGDTSDSNNLEAASRIASLLDDHRGGDTVALDVHEICSFADYLILTTVNSQGHLRGLITRLDGLFDELGVVPLRPRRRSEDAGWVLIDLGFAVIHLMTQEMRDFYELERLWFGAPTVFPKD